MTPTASASDTLSQSTTVSSSPLAQRLVPVLTGTTGLTSAGYPYLCESCFQLFRDTVPHILGMGPEVVDALSSIEEAARGAADLTQLQRDSITRAAEVVRGCVNTAAITAPSDLWLLRFVVGTFVETGLAATLLAGEPISAHRAQLDFHGEHPTADPVELEADLYFLLSRGYLSLDEQERFTLAPWPQAREVFERLTPVPLELRQPLASLWARVFRGEPVTQAQASALHALGRNVPRRVEARQTHWAATAGEVELGFRLLPVVLGLRASRVSGQWPAAGGMDPLQLAPRQPELGEAALNILLAAGCVNPPAGGEGAYTLTAVGARTLSRGPGPMGIIEAYRPYMQQLSDILAHGRGQAWVTRGDNIAASQDANRRTFQKANDALDTFCDQTGFSYTVFIEHAIGRGEATRQRYARPGGSELYYVGADLEDAAIDACLEAQQRGELPEGMVFVRSADIGVPQLLTKAIKDAGLDPRGAVMIVGNGFHEVRGQSDEGMVEVFRGYHDAGLILLFTEESALSVDDLLQTAWNTYHAGFKYVHEKSGQALRPAEAAPNPRLGHPLRASWRECAERAGYVAVTHLSSRSRRIYPTRPADGHNPAISVNHFLVPEPIARGLHLND